MTHLALPQHMVTRFAPSPTGLLHVGHGWSALMAMDMARAAGGAFRLRIEDIDGTRSRPEHIVGIVADLAWLGVTWDGEIVFQSQRLDRYESALAQLRAHGLLYPCFCTRADIQASLTAPHGAEGPVYPGTCRHLSDAVRARRIAEGEAHAWRIDMGRAVARVGELGWAAAYLKDAMVAPVPDSERAPHYDANAGRPRSKSVPAHPPEPVSESTPASQSTDPAARWMLDHVQHDGEAKAKNWGEHRIVAHPLAHGDVVLARKDAPASYHLSCTLDDAAMGVTHVLRGSDLRGATDIHRLIQALLDLPSPIYVHHPLLIGADGRRLAKRDGSIALADLRAQGMNPAMLVADLRAGRFPFGITPASA